MASQPPGAAPSRWTSYAGVVVAIAGLTVTLIGLLIAVGKWEGDTEGHLARTDDHLATLDKRMEQAESNQRTYIPVLVKMTADVSYLADRARRDDDRAERGRR